MGAGSVGRRERRDGQERPGLIELATAGRTPDPVVTHLRTPPRKHMLEEALEKLAPARVTRRRWWVRLSR